MTDQAKRVAMEFLQRARNKPNFGNAGEVDIMLDRAKGLHQKHLSSGQVKHMDTFEAIDIDPEFDRGVRAATNLPLLFQDVVGCEDIIKQMQNYQTTAANMRELNMDPREQIPFNFLFKGPPGMIIFSGSRMPTKHFGRHWENHHSAENGESVLRHGLSWSSKSY